MVSFGSYDNIKDCCVVIETNYWTYLFFYFEPDWVKSIFSSHETWPTAIVWSLNTSKNSPERFHWMGSNKIKMWMSRCYSNKFLDGFFLIQANCFTWDCRRDNNRWIFPNVKSIVWRGKRYVLCNALTLKKNFLTKLPHDWLCNALVFLVCTTNYVWGRWWSSQERMTGWIFVPYKSSQMYHISR